MGHKQCHELHRPLGYSTGGTSVVDDLLEGVGCDHRNRMRIKIVDQLLLLHVDPVEYLLNLWVACLALGDHLDK